jgi:uncharacterized protein (DUF885 family)
MKHLVLAALIAISATPAAAAAQSPAPAMQASTALARIIDDYEAFRTRSEPGEAAREGDLAARSRLADVSLAADQQRARELKALKARLDALPAAQLNPKDRLNRDLLDWSLEDQLGSLAFDEARLPFTAYESFDGALEDEAGETRFERRADVDAYLARMGQAARLYAQETENARRGLATGFVQPKLVVEVTLVTARKQAAETDADSRWLTPFAHLPAGLSAEEGAALKAKALDILNREIRPAQQAYVAFLEREYLPKARVSLAARDLPDGERYYAFLVHRHTTTAMTPDEVHRLGEAEVARIRREMDRIIAETGFKGTFPEFLAYLRTDPQFYAKSREELFRTYTEIAKRIDGELPREFGVLPRLTYGVKPTPAAVEEHATTAYYNEGSPAIGRSGTFTVNLSHLDQRPLYEAPTLTLHEAVPGHHLQIALAQEQPDQPRFRRSLGFTAFVEGWALYGEQLGGELNVYRTPYERFGQLSYEMWRACRLVADTGIHWLRWSRDEAKACFLHNTALAPHNIDVEVDRYISWPGQALGYKIGELRIMALRKEAEAKLGERFDVRRFHDAVLLGGALPLDLVEARVRAWIAEEATKPAKSGAAS